MKILLFGSNGQVGWELQRSLTPLGQLIACDRQLVDLENRRAISAAIHDHDPDIIVNAAAYTAVDKAETEPEKAQAINVKAVELLADEAKRRNSWLLHYSTDYVFDGRKSGLYTETDQPNPLNTYGRTKLEGEIALQESGCRYLIFRTSWVYSARGANFVTTIMRLAAEKDRLDVVVDQTGAPTSAEFIADATSACLYHILKEADYGEHLAGIYHLTASGSASWYSFARYLLDQKLVFSNDSHLCSENIHPVTTAQYRSLARRPLNSRLDTQKLSDTFSIYPPPWQFHAQRLIAELSRRES